MFTKTHNLMIMSNRKFPLPATVSLLTIVTALSAIAVACDPHDDSSEADTPELPDLPSAAPDGPRNRVPRSDADLVAERFVASHAHLVRSWENAHVGTGVEVFGAEDVAYYHYPILGRREEAAGSVTIGAHDGRGVVAAFTVDGLPATTTLLAGLSDALGTAVDASSVQFLAEGPALIFAEVPWDPDLGRPEVYGLIAGTDDHLAYYSPDLATLTPLVDRAEWPSHARELAWDVLDDERELRSLYLTLEGDVLRDKVAASKWNSAPVIKKRTVWNQIGDGASSFDSWYQELRDWGNGSCYAGCAPVAAAILLDYWDENGKGGILPGSSDSPTTTDARASIKGLRSAMGTYCKGNEGATPIANVDLGRTFTKNRGYNWTWTEHTSSMWSTIHESIDSGYPVILTAKLNNNAIHSAVVVEYTDDWGSANDIFCWKTGWTSPTYQCLYNSAYAWYNVVRVTPY